MHHRPAIDVHCCWSVAIASASSKLTLACSRSSIMAQHQVVLGPPLLLFPLCGNHVMATLAGWWRSRQRNFPANRNQRWATISARGSMPALCSTSLFIIRSQNFQNSPEATLSEQVQLTDCCICWLPCLANVEGDWDNNGVEQMNLDRCVQ